MHDEDALFPHPVHFMQRPELNDLLAEPSSSASGSGGAPGDQSATSADSDSLPEAVAVPLQGQGVGASENASPVAPSASSNAAGNELASVSDTSIASNSSLAEGTGAQPPPPTPASTLSLSATASDSSTARPAPATVALSSAEPASSSTTTPRAQFDRGSITTPLPVTALGELVRESTELAELARPAFERWQELLRSDPDLREAESESSAAATASTSASRSGEAPEVAVGTSVRRKSPARAAQDVHELCARLMHLLSHVWHSISQFLVDFSGTPRPPRNVFVLSQMPVGTVFMQPVAVRSITVHEYVKFYVL